MESSSGVALVTTAWLRSREPHSRHVDVLNTFLLYHISIGVDCIFVFFDGGDAQQPTVDVLLDQVKRLVQQGRIELFYRHDTSNGAGVSSPCNHALRYADCHNYEKLQAGIIRGDVASRQMLHAEMAMTRCIQRNSTTAAIPQTRWLLHLDIDELFFCHGFPSASGNKDSDCEGPKRVLCEVVRTLEQATERIDQLTVANYEGVPTSQQGDNYFTSTTKFRRHTARIPISAASQDALRRWQLRSPYDQFFLFYDNGKSLVRVPVQDDHPVMVPASVHHWKPAAPGETTARSVSNFYDPRRTDSSQWHTAKSALQCCVLHYPVCGLEWLVDKYERLGAFPAVWGGAESTLKIHPCFHLQARDASCLKDGRATTALEKLYNEQVMVPEDDTSFWSSQLSSGVCEEITFPRELLAAQGFSLPAYYDSCRSSSRDDHTAIAQESQALATVASDASGFTVQKAWMMAAISNQYL